MVASSRRSLASSARSVSRWLLTDTYSPSAMDTAPATNPATPAVRIGPRALVAPATPTTRPAVETIPSLAPSTPARSQFIRCDSVPTCGSRGCAGDPPRRCVMPCPAVDQGRGEGQAELETGSLCPQDPTARLPRSPANALSRDVLTIDRRET